MQIFNWLTNYASFINQFWIFTIFATLVLYIICNTLPDRIVGKYLPLHNVFKPQTNVDLDYQSIGYALLHTTWLTKLTHSTIVIEVVLWFIIFQSWHWSIVLLAFFLVALQSYYIGDKKFGLFFIFISLLTFGISFLTIRYLGKENAILISKALLMLGGLMRMLSHSAELIPPILVDDSDKFQKLSLKNFNWRVLFSTPIGYLGEFGSSLPSRILPIQVNYLFQNVLRFKPQSIMPWSEVNASANKVLAGGYTKQNTLKNYYNSVIKSS
jgi:hypothetical protein